MLNLRVHGERAGAGAPGAEVVFYTQRADGPHYRWRRVERGLGQWHFTRLHPAEWNPKILSRLNEKDVPAALQVRLAEHYKW